MQKATFRSIRLGDTCVNAVNPSLGGITLVKEIRHYLTAVLIKLDAEPITELVQSCPNMVRSQRQDGLSCLTSDQPVDDRTTIHTRHRMAEDTTDASPIAFKDPLNAQLDLSALLNLTSTISTQSVQGSKVTIPMPLKCLTLRIATTYRRNRRSPQSGSPQARWHCRRHDALARYRHMRGHRYPNGRIRFSESSRLTHSIAAASASLRLPIGRLANL